MSLLVRVSALRNNVGNQMKRGVKPLGPSIPGLKMRHVLYFLYYPMTRYTCVSNLVKVPPIALVGRANSITIGIFQIVLISALISALAS